MLSLLSSEVTKNVIKAAGWYNYKQPTYMYTPFPMIIACLSTFRMNFWCPSPITPKIFTKIGYMFSDHCAPCYRVLNSKNCFLIYHILKMSTETNQIKNYTINNIVFEILVSPHVACSLNFWDMIVHPPQKMTEVHLLIASNSY